MREALRAGVDGVAGNQAGVPWIRPQVVTEAVRNMGQEAQWCRVSRVVACDGYF